MKRILAIAAMALLATGCSGDEEKSSGGKHVRAVNITTASTIQRDIDVTETAVGRIEDPHFVQVAAEVAAQVDKVFVDAGSAVAKGDVLAQLDTGDVRASLSAAEADVARQQAQLASQKRLVARYRQLANEKFVSPTLLDEAEAQLITLQKAVVAAKAARSRAHNDLARTKVRAPVAGRIQQRLTAPGSYASKGTVLFTLAAGERLSLSIPFPETKASLLHAGQVVRLRLPGRDTVTEAQISELTPMIGVQTGAFEARVELNNPGAWRPGGSVVAEVIIARHKGALLVPQESVVLRPAGEVVYVIDGDKASERKVRTGVSHDNMVEILNGLKAGETVAYHGAGYLSDGASVHVLQESGQ